MSVIIPNMKMPMSCLACPLAREMFNCLVCVGYFKDNLTGRRVYKSDLKESDADFNRPDWCPLAPLPEGHGRLIDADALDRAFTDLRFNSDGTLNHWGDRPGWCMHGYEVEKLIADAPTIIEADRRKAYAKSTELYSGGLTMENDFISRQAAIRIVCDDECEDCPDGGCDMYRRLKRLPAADVRPVVSGEGYGL